MVRIGRQIVFFSCFLSLLAGGLSCNPVSNTKEEVAGGRLIIPVYQKPAFINPLFTETTLSARLSELVFDGLVQLDEQFNVKPHLAESWEQSENGRIWNFKIKKGVTFHDGVNLTAEDVAFTFNLIKELKKENRYGFIFQDVEEIRVEEKYKVEITLERPLASFPERLNMGILPKHLLAGKALRRDRFNQHPIGTGPFRLKKWSETGIELEANRDYFLGRPNLDLIQVKVYPSQEAAWAKLMAGEVDFFDYLTPTNFEVVKKIPTFNFYSVPMPFYYVIAFNFKEEMFVDKRVRQALNYAINKGDIVDKVLKGQGQVSGGTIFPASWAYNPAIEPCPYDPRKALALLQEAGWADHDGDFFLDKDGRTFEFTIHVNAGDDLKQKALLIIQQQLLDLGIRVKVEIFNADKADFLFEKKFQAHFPEIAARGDPDFSYKYWHSSQINGGFNVSSYRNEEVDRLLEEGRFQIEQKKRKGVYFRFQEEILEDPPGIFLFWTHYLVGVHKRVKGVRINAVGPFSNIREWYVPENEQRPRKTPLLEGRAKK